jgi:hypothetical protein
MAKAHMAVFNHSASEHMTCLPISIAVWQRLIRKARQARIAS